MGILAFLLTATQIVVVAGKSEECGSAACLSHDDCTEGDCTFCQAKSETSQIPAFCVYNNSLGVASLTSSLQKIIDAGAHQDNISYSFAVVSTEFTATVAAGADDRKSGTQVTTDSMYPAGSVTKPYTAVAAMRLYDQGLLDLEEPVHKILDPWLKSQSIPPLLSLWKNDPTIESVTSRQLLGMQAGFLDYADGYIRNWTINHPHQDYLPMDFIDALDKTFRFKPGAGAAYSSDGFVLMGLVLTAVSGGTTWSDFDQLKALGPVQPPFNGTIFMKVGLHASPSQYTHPPQMFFVPGKTRFCLIHCVLPSVVGCRFCFRPFQSTCSKYPRVVHQYTVCTAQGDYSGGCTQPNSTDAPTAPFESSTAPFNIPNGSPSAKNAACKLYKGVALMGPTVGNITTVANVSACCSYARAYAKHHKQNVVFTFLHGNCSVFAHYGGSKANPDAISGTFELYPPKPLVPSSFYDLYQTSCLNG
jgi:hypothetical protein